MLYNLLKQNFFMENNDVYIIFYILYNIIFSKISLKMKFLNDLGFKCDFLNYIYSHFSEYAMDTTG